MAEMGKYLRQTVDNSLEEGQFESAVTLLAQLCSPDHIPSPVHVLHLVAIALHPSSSPSTHDDAPALLLQSPRKIIKHTKSALVLEPPAVLAAQSLLHALLRTNGPAALARALPAYPDPTAAARTELEFVDSPIFHQAAALRNARSVWDIVKGGYATKAVHVFGTPKGRAKQQPRSSVLAKEPELDDIKVVGDDSWFLLDWLVALFEADADATHKSGFPKHSPLLLKQLPPPPTGSSTRWDASEPLKVVFYAFKQHDHPRHQRTGLRLLTLLIDLTHSAFLNLPSFAATVLSQLAASCSSSSSSSSGSPSPSSSSAPVTPPRHPHPPAAATADPTSTWTPQDALTALFTRLPSTPAALAFKIVLCKKILAELDATPNVTADASFSDLSGKGKPVSRVGSASVPNPQTNGASSSFTATFGANAPSVSGGGQPQSTVPRPRPIPKARPLAPPPPQQLQRTDTVSDVSAGPPISPSVSMTMSSVGIISPSNSNPPPAAAPAAPARAATPLPPLPPLPDIARLLHLHPLPPPSLAPAPGPSDPSSSSSPNSNSNSNSKTQSKPAPRRSRTSASARATTPAPTSGQTQSQTQTQTQTQSQSPWTAPPALLLRVKFELLLAWVALRRTRRAAAEEKAKDGERGEDKEKEKDKNDVSDAELAGVIDAVFGANANTGAEEGGEGEGEMSFYRDALRAFAGMPIGKGASA